MEINPGAVALGSLRVHAAAAAAAAQRERDRQAAQRQARETAARRSHRPFAEATRGMTAGRLPASRAAVVTADVCGPCHDVGATTAEHMQLCGGTDAQRWAGPRRAAEITR